MRTVVASHELLPKGLDLEGLGIEAGKATIFASSCESKARCPLCGSASPRAHSRYLRAASDLPWAVEGHPAPLPRGADPRHICKRLGVSATTVYRCKDLEEPPPRRGYKKKASVLDPYIPYLVARWEEGCHNGKPLCRNSEETCARFIAQLRRAEVRGRPISSVPRAKQGSVAGLPPTAKNVAALFMRHEEKLDEEQEAYLDRLCEADEAPADTRRLTREFSEMLRKLEGEDLDGWLKDAEESRSKAMRSFAAGLRRGLEAVRAGAVRKVACRSHHGPPSTGHVEFGAIVAGVEALLADTEQADWQNRFEWMAKVSG